MNSKISSTITIFVICMSISDTIMAQRPSFAGPRPQSGYKDRFRTPTEAPAQEIISNRFGEDLNRPQVSPSPSVNVVRPAIEFVPINNPTNQNTDLTNRFSSDSGITERLPYDALGDKELVKYYNSLPEDQRPFWLINAKAIEAQRNSSGGSGRNTNVIAERGSFAGPSLVSNNRRIVQDQQLQRFPQIQPQSQQQNIQQEIQQDQRQIQLLQLQLQQQRQLDQQQLLQRQIQELQQRLQQKQSQSSNVLSSRADFGSSNTGSSFVNNLRPSQNQLSNSVNVLNEVDSKGGRFVYVDANLYKILKQNNLVV